MKNGFGTILARIFIYVMLAVMYAPIAILIIFSFSGSSGIGAWSNFDFTGDLYLDLFQDASILGAVGNTFLIAIISSIIATVIGSVSAVGIYYLPKRIKPIVSGMNQITVVNAEIVTAVAFMLFFIVCFGYMDGYPALIISHTMITIPYVILSVMPRLAQLNPNLYEAARDLGSGPFKALTSVLLPQMLPGIISGFVMAFTLSLDDFVITLFNKGSGIETISTLIYSSTKHGIAPAFRALSTIIFVGVLAVLIGINIFQARARRKAIKGA